MGAPGRDSGARPGLTTVEQQRIKELEREVRELRKTNEIVKLASAYFAQAELELRQIPSGQPVLQRHGQQHFLLRFVGAIAHPQSRCPALASLSGTFLLPPTLLVKNPGFDALMMNPQQVERRTV